jgi:hypothetical protein
LHAGDLGVDDGAGDLLFLVLAKFFDDEDAVDEVWITLSCRASILALYSCSLRMVSRWSPGRSGVISRLTSATVMILSSATATMPLA